MLKLVLREFGLGSPGLMRATIHLQGRPLSTEEIATAAVPVEVTFEAPGVTAQPAFDKVQRDATLGAAVRVARRLGGVLAALVESLTGAMSVNDPRRAWLGESSGAVTASTLAAITRAAWVEALELLEGEPARRKAAESLRERHPALASTPAWRTSEGERWVSVDALRAEAAKEPGRVLGRGRRGATGRRARGAARRRGGAARSRRCPKRRGGSTARRRSRGRSARTRARCC
ncbi:MAG: hypothetical protein R3A52_14330 [Polyangiales bacterium]